MAQYIHIIGAGLAGSEAAWQAAKRGVRVVLSEMRPKQMTKAHRSSRCAELVCSNSFRGAALSNAVGLLKEELKVLDTLFMEAALKAQVPAGGALAVDREIFSAYIDEKIKTHPLIEFRVEKISKPTFGSDLSPKIIATGPLTSPTLARTLEGLTGAGNLAFFDAISPIILGESINMERVFRQSRYDKGGDDYLNIALDAEKYYTFVEDIKNGEKFGGHEEVEGDCIENLRPFEGCMPIEEMVSRGPETLRYGPLKPVGLTDPVSGKRPYAVVQLRQDDKAGALWSMVGMQTRLKHPEQQRIFRSLPGMEQAEFVRLGSVHRNTFIDSPKCLLPTLQFEKNPTIFFAGQITGVEGYVESAASGFVTGVNAVRLIRGEDPLVFPATTAIGGLLHYISDRERKFFQPMNISFGLISGYIEEGHRRLSKNDRRLKVAEKALQEVKRIKELELLSDNVGRIVAAG